MFTLLSREFYLKEFVVGQEYPKHWNFSEGLAARETQLEI